MNERHIPVLDGWRGIAILMVLVCHFRMLFLHQYNHLLGQQGVQIFFVLSGFLITSNLLSDKETDLKSFYVRRVFRILPVTICYLVLLVIVLMIFRIPIKGSGIGYTALFIRNYSSSLTHLAPSSSFTGQFWSLSVEEQFYLLWPASLCLLGRRTAASCAAFLVVVIDMARAIFPNYFLAHYKHTEVRADALLIGCLLAFALKQGAIRLFVRKHARWILPLSLAIFAVDCYRFEVFIPSSETIAIAGMLAATVINPEMFASRILETSPLKMTGKLSYSIYVWQTLLLQPLWGYAFPLLLALTVLVSYYKLEEPMRKVGRKLANRHRAANREAEATQPA